MATSVRYDGPAGQANHDVGRATGGGDLLEPGAVYDLPAELAERLVESSAWWSRVDSFEELNVAQLRQLAAERQIERRSKMTRDELVAALRGEDAPPAGADAAAGEGGDQAAAADPGEPATPADEDAAGEGGDAS